MLIRKRENGLFLSGGFDFILGSNVDFDLVHHSEPELVLHYKAGILSPFPLFLFEVEDRFFNIECENEKMIIIKGRSIDMAPINQYRTSTFLIKDSAFIIKNRKLEKREEISDRNGFVDDNFQNIVVPPSFIL